MKSLDPRVNRLKLEEGSLHSKDPLDQFGTYEVFTQLNENKPFMHAGNVHAPNMDMAFIFAKEQFSRRQTCSGLFVAKTSDVHVTKTTENGENIYDNLVDDSSTHGHKAIFEIFHLMKRGKQHEHIGSVEALSYIHALSLAKEEFINGNPVLNSWVIKSDNIRYSTVDDRIIWKTLPEKTFREATDYKAGDILKKFKD